MNKNLIFTTIILFCVGYTFSQDTTYLDSKWNTSTKDKCSYFRVESKQDNLYQRIDYFNSTNQIQMKGTYESFDPEVKTGDFIWYHSNGEVKHVGEYRHNKEIGEHIWYFDNGEIEAVENYVNGVFHGLFKEYYKNGKISIYSSFKNGLQSGLTKYYRDDGSLQSEGEFKDGDKNGIWKFYDNEGELLGTQEFKTDYLIPEAKMILKLPNSKWSLADQKEGEYIFKREPIKNKNGLDIIPAIMVYIEDASDYEQDVTLYTIGKQRVFKSKGVNIDTMLIQDSDDYPLTYKNAYFIKSSYTSQGLDHIFFMIHIINKDNKGIQIYLDMTKDIAKDYEQEFWTTIRSIKEE